MAALVILSLSGCIAEEAPPANPLFGLCPQWEAGDLQQAGTVVLNATVRDATQILAPGEMQKRSLPFDMVRVRIDSLEHSGGDVRLSSANANGSALIWRDFRPQVPQVAAVIVFASGDETGHIFETYLTSVSQDDPPRPGPVHLTWRLDGMGAATVSYTATFHYKVCGAAFSNP